MVTNASNCSAWEVEAGGSGVQVSPQLHSKFKASVGYRNPHKTTFVLVNHHCQLTGVGISYKACLSQKCLGVFPDRVSSREKTHAECGLHN